ncbi:pantoate--beta-alanine ligase [Pleomorphomonas diazotrophica]|uniref:Pantothenate synthetase n=1 Tax=Pleomorphomonas diazotrophica TaxID=1166257 RepID=A0A1I4UAM2_9HYPH|nr:pantoate--beta-alanine ligase [Pleomorphomonas diazotrophica]PKR91287.1 pantoate--beta-alanine ligase [Pleomorphomonas diazotrophica]SFM86004.1 pantothenate synthetase [Pleomorphomonas diazotrophica]
MPLETVTKIAELRERLRPVRQAGQSIGLVPTMGYLHRGHAALVDRARAENDVVVVSVFVNPLQFGPKEDFASYPRDLDADRKLLAEHGADIVFAPSVEEMYPRPITTHIEVEELSVRLEGERRPGHFRGVATVVGKLFNIALPDRAYFGEKDYQQLQVIRRMVADLSFPLEIVGVPTVRDVDGVALSSRNVYLSPVERAAAPVLSRSLAAAADAIGGGTVDPQDIEAVVRGVLADEPLAAPDLVAVAAADTLEPIDPKAPPPSIALMLAVRIGRTRLLDQRVVAVP